MVYVILLIGSFLLGLILLAIGSILLFRLKNKIAGILVLAAGAAFTVCPLAVIAIQTITVRTQG